METSAKASINVEEAFFALARDIKAKMDKKLVGMAWNLLAKSHVFKLIPFFSLLKSRKIKIKPQEV